jgi:hypothetical protein
MQEPLPDIAVEQNEDIYGTFRMKLSSSVMDFHGC